jgi:hypothetical protein
MSYFGLMMIYCTIILEGEVLPKETGVVVGNLQDIWFWGLYKSTRVGKNSFASSIFLLTSSMPY